MATLTVKRARKILGKVAQNFTDEEIEKEIKFAEVMKQFYFSLRRSKQNYSEDKETNGKA